MNEELYNEEAEMNAAWCDRCMSYHSSSFDCEDWEDEDEED